MLGASSPWDLFLHKVVFGHGLLLHPVVYAILHEACTCIDVYHLTNRASHGFDSPGSGLSAPCGRGRFEDVHFGLLALRYYNPLMPRLSLLCSC